MGVFDPTTGEIEEYQIPYSDGPEGTPPFVGNVSALQCIVRTGKDGMVYGGAGTRDEMVKVNPVTRELSIIAPPDQSILGNLLNFNDAWGADKGMYVSSTTGNKVHLYHYDTGEWDTFNAQTPLSGPLGMRTDAKQNLWFTNFFGQFISKIDNQTGEVTEYHNVPQPGGAFPEVLRASTENQKYLWANAFGAGGFIRISVEEDPPVFDIFTNPSLTAEASFPFENDNDYCGRVWYSSPTLNQVSYYDPHTDEWTNVDVPQLPVPAGNFEVAMHRGPQHAMWITAGIPGFIGRYQLDEDCTGEDS